MADKTGIEWTDATWNPITGCSVISPGCTNCYAMRLAGTRLAKHPSRAGLTVDSKAGPVWTGEVRLNEAWLDQPLRWRRPRRIFPCAHGDLFHPSVPFEWIDRVWAVMALGRRHEYQVLTKRSDRMRAYLADPSLPARLARAVIDLCLKKLRRFKLAQEHWPVLTIGDDVDNPDDIIVDLPLPNVWLGVSAEDQRRADERIPDLLATPAAVRFVSLEPLLGPIDLAGWLWGADQPCDGCPRDIDCECGSSSRRDIPDAIAPGALDWVIAGGESGPGARPMHPDWVRGLRDQCVAAGVPFFLKQWGEWHPDSLLFTEVVSGLCPPPGMKVGKKAAGRLLDDRTWDEFPRIKQEAGIGTAAG